jgi:RNA 2',3'-cyclic 3'-phosphodiesterase
MRLFVAIVPPAAVLAELAAAVRPLQAEAPDLRWASTSSWHLTLAFLGEVNERILPDLSMRLERAARRHPPQRLAIASGGAFPVPSRARVVWAGVAADNGALRALAGSVAAGARRAGAPPPDEKRKYHPHLTLARCREPADVTTLTAALAGFSTSAWTAPSVHLIRSYLGGSEASRYEVIADWPLAGRLRTGPSRTGT